MLIIDQKSAFEASVKVIQYINKTLDGMYTEEMRYLLLKTVKGSVDGMLSGQETVMGLEAKKKGGKNGK